MIDDAGREEWQLATLPLLTTIHTWKHRSIEYENIGDSRTDKTI